MRGLFEFALAASSALKRAVDTPTCAAGIHMIVARGTNEAPGAGLMGSVAKDVVLQVAGSDWEALEYPATFTDYPDSVGDGAVEFTRLVTEYTKRCPNTKIALLGYSQGAHALMDSICGTEARGFDMIPELSDSFESSIIAVVTFGDPSHIVDAPWNVGTSERDGLYPRENITTCEPYSPIIRGYCDTGDTYCDLGKDRSVHSSYFGTYTDDVIKFIKDNYEEAIASSSSATPSSSSTSAPTASSTTGPASSTSAAPASSTTPSGEPSAAPSSSSLPGAGNAVSPSVLVLIAGVVIPLLA